jgi:saccharopine dehydrogenase (NAD+, L-lysine-forming)
MNVLVLGCGEMGETAVRDLYHFSTFDSITVATRTVERARRVVSELTGPNREVRAERLDVNDTEALAHLMADSDVVINCVGPNYKHEVGIAETAISAGVPLIDINDDYQTTLEMLELDEKAKAAGILVVLGMGASPGINNIFARAAADQLDAVEEVHTLWVMSGADPGGPALSYHLLHSLSDKALTWENGSLIEVRSFIDGKERIIFPEPVGPLDVFFVGHPEPITLSRTFPEAKVITDKATFHPRQVNDWIRNLGQWARGFSSPIRAGGMEIDAMDLAAAYFHKRCKSMMGVGKEGALRTHLKGRRGGRKKTVIYASSGLISNGTGMPAAIGAQMLIEGNIHGCGVMAPEACVDWRDFLDRIIRRRIGRLDIWEE